MLCILLTSCSSNNQLLNNVEVSHPNPPAPISLEYPQYKKVENFICVPQNEYNKLYNNRLEIIRYLEQNRNVLKHYRKNINE